MNNKNQINDQLIDLVATNATPVSISSSDGIVYSESSSFGRRLDNVRQSENARGSCPHTGWDS